MAVRTFTMYGFDRVAMAEELTIGQTVYPVESTHIHRGDTWFTVQPAPARTNQSRETRTYGYLGTTNNVQMTALGSGVVVSVNVRTLKDGRERADVKVKM